VTDRAEGRNGCLAAPDIGVGTGSRGEVIHGGDHLPLPEGPAGRFGDESVRVINEGKDAIAQAIGKTTAESSVESTAELLAETTTESTAGSIFECRGRVTATDLPDLLACTAPDARSTVGDGPLEVGGVESTAPGQRAERGSTHRGVGVGEVVSNETDVGAMAGDDHGSPALCSRWRRRIDAGLNGRFHGRIVMHLDTSMTTFRPDPPPDPDHDRGTTPDPARDGGTTPDAARSVGAKRPGRRRRRWPKVLVVVVALVAVLAVIASRIQLGYYVLTPGQAEPVGPLVKVPASKAHRIDGPILLTDVYVTRVSLLSYLPDKLNGDAELLTTTELLGPYTPPGELTAQGYLEMAQAQAAAKAAALRRLGYSVHEVNAGTLVFSVVPGSPAAPVLKVGEIIKSVNGVPTPTACSFVSALRPYGPGRVVRLDVEHSTVTSSATMRPGPSGTEDIRLGRPPRGLEQEQATTTDCPGASSSATGYLGVEIETEEDFGYPVPVSVSTSTIGGPSAGLAMTLAIIDKLYGGDLAGGRTVAATGTISPTGAVGPVGGVAEKTIAVERAGATVFLVPPQEFPTAKSKDIPSLHIYKVSSLSEALATLQRLGGRVPPAHSADNA